MMKNVVLEVKNLEKSFGKLKAVNNISFTVEKGDIFGFLGPNGSGKTTTIRLILSLLKPDNGEIYINNLDIKNHFYASLSKVGALVEGPAFYEYLTAQENLEVFGSYCGGVKKEKIEELLDLVGLSDRRRDKVSQYSLGMKQRLGIAQALLNDPDLIILDEPINGLDPQGIRDIRKIMNHLSEKGITIFLSSHILSEVEQTCNKVFIINKGKKIVAGSTSELIKNKNHYEIIATDNVKLIKVLENINGIQIDSVQEAIRITIFKQILPEDLLTQLIGEGLKIKMYTPIKLSLEEYFFKSLEAN